MSVEEPRERPEGTTDVYGKGRRNLVRPDKVEPGKQCHLRFRNRETGDLHDMKVEAMRTTEDASEGSRLHCKILCRGAGTSPDFHREFDLQFDEESGCLVQICRGERYEIGYVVRVLEDPDEQIPAQPEESTDESEPVSVA